MSVHTWESAVFGQKLQGKKNQNNIRTRATLTRKLLLAPGDVGMHGPSEMAAQAKYFSSQQFQTQSRFLSAYINFIAFDMVAAHILPPANRDLVNDVQTVHHEKVLLPQRVVNVRPFIRLWTE